MLIEGLFGREKTRLEEVAWDVRRQFETGEAYTERLMRLYRDILSHNPYGLEDFFRKAKAQFPKRNCGIATVALYDRLGIGEIAKGSSYQGIAHTMLTIGGDRGIMVDITADQFGGPKVYVGQIRDPWYIRRW